MTDAAQLFRMEIDPEVYEQLLAIEEQETQARTDFARQIVKFGAILCNCPKRFDWDDVAPTWGCIVHGQNHWDPQKERFLY